MFKWILLLLFTFINQAFAFQYSPNSTFVFADFLYWQLQEVGADNWAEIITPAATDQSIQALGVPFQWDPGVRVGAGYQSQSTQWDTVFYYTWYQTIGTDQVGAIAGAIHSPNLGNFFVGDPQATGLSGPVYQSAGIDWKLMFNTFDWEVGRQFEFNQKFKVRPFMGIKGAIIDQTINTSWQDPINFTPTFTSATEDFTNNFWGLGPSLGLNTSWMIYHSGQHAISIFGDFSGAFLWGQWTFSDVYKNDLPISVSVMNDTMSTTSTMARGYVGLNWDGFIKKTNVNIRLGYETQVWLNQLRFYSFNMGRQDNPFYLQGGVLDFCIHF